MKRLLTLLSVLACVAGLACVAPAAASTTAPATTATPCPWVGSHASAQVKADEVLSRMTLTEKLSMLGGSSTGEGYAGYVPAIPSLCVPALKLEDNGSGVGDGLPDITALPDGEADAATWDPTLMKEYGQVVGDEQRAKGTNVVLGPMINIMRDPRWGRNYETFSEDPYLTSVAGVADVEGIQSQGLIATVKHIGAYDQEYNRTQVNSVVSQRALEEIYLSPFQATIQQAGAGAIMAAADYTNGVYDNADPFLLAQSAKTDWGFPGFVMSDWDGAHSVSALAAGLDLSMPTPGNFGAPLLSAIQDGSVSMAYVNDAVERILYEMFTRGLFEHPDTGAPSSPASTPAHVAFAEKDAEQSTVLLKNNGQTLPLDAAKNQSVAVIGAAGGTDPKAVGCGSGAVTPTNVVSPLQGIEKLTGTSTELYSFNDGTTDGWQPGTNIASVSAASSFANGSPYDGGYSLDAASGTVAASAPRTVQITPATPLDLSDARGFSVEVNGYGGAPGATGYQATVTLSSGSQTLTTTAAISPNQWNQVTMNVSGWSYRDDITGISVSYAAVGSTTPWSMHFQLDDVSWSTADVSYSDGSDVSAAASLAALSDVAIVVVNDEECEQGGASYDDRTSLDLGSDDDSLISSVVAANPDTIVVLDTGSPVTGTWMSQVPAIVEGWYPGQEDGDAIAAVLFGDADPAGRLPQTWPASESQMPTSSSQSWGNATTDEFSEGIDVGYRWYEANHVTPLYPFGYGLSYTTFAFSHEKVTPAGPPGGTSVRVTATVTNTGHRSGWEVAQLYVGDPAAAGEPPKQLEGFQKVELKPGQSAPVSFVISGSNLRYWDDSTSSWAVAPGTYSFMIGDSSAGTPPSAGYTVTSTTGPRTVTVTAPSTVDAGATATVTATLTSGGTQTLHGVRVSLDVPAGWRAAPVTPVVAGSVAPGQRVATRWRVTAPASASARLVRLTGTASFGNGSLSGAQQVLVPETVTGQFTPVAAIVVPGTAASASLTLTNNAGVATATSLNVSSPDGVTATPAVTTVRLAPGASQTVPVALGATQSGVAGTVDIGLSTAGPDGAVVDNGDALLNVQTPYASLAQAFNNTGITDNSAPSAGNFDGAGNSYSAQQLATAGITPGATISHDGASFSWPDVASGVADNVQANGQTIEVSGSGSSLAFLVAGTHGNPYGTGTVIYTDGTTQSFTLTATNWTGTAPASGDDLLVTTSSENGGGGLPVSIYGTTVPINPAKTVAAVTLPATLQGGDGSGLQTAHVFGIAVASS